VLSLTAAATADFGIGMVLFTAKGADLIHALLTGTAKRLSTWRGQAAPTGATGFVLSIGRYWSSRFR